MDIKQKIKEIWKENSKKKIYRICGVAAGVVLLAFVGKAVADNWNYKSYKVVTETVREDTLSTRYTRFGENILKYSGDDVTLLNRQGGWYGTNLIPWKIRWWISARNPVWSMIRMAAKCLYLPWREKRER